MKVVAFNGSARPKGNTFTMLNMVLDELKSADIDTELIQMSGRPLQGCIGCFKCVENKDRRCVMDNDPLNEFMARMIEADGILLGSPVYFADLTASMKALIERCGMVSRANGHLLRRKAGAAVVAVRRAGSIHTFDSLNHFFFISQMIVPGSSYWNMGLGKAPGEVANDAEGAETMKNLGLNMAWLLERIHR